MDHIDYVVRLTGWEHVGLGLDYVVDQQELIDYVKAHPELYPPGSELCKFVPPESLGRIAELLANKGYSEEALAGILGGNFLRIAEKVWK